MKQRVSSTFEGRKIGTEWAYVLLIQISSEYDHYKDHSFEYAHFYV